MIKEKSIWNYLQVIKLRGPQFGLEYPTNRIMNGGNSIIYLGKNIEGSDITMRTSEFDMLLKSCVWLSNGRKNAVFLDQSDEGNVERDTMSLRLLDVRLHRGGHIYLQHKGKFLKCNDVKVRIRNGLLDVAILNNATKCRAKGMCGNMDLEKVKDLVSNLESTSTRWIDSGRFEF